MLEDDNNVLGCMLAMKLIVKNGMLTMCAMQHIQQQFWMLSPVKTIMQYMCIYIKHTSHTYGNVPTKDKLYISSAGNAAAISLSLS